MQKTLTLYIYRLIFISLLVVAYPAFAQTGDYQSTITKADNYFAQKDYYNAKSTYQLALKIKPDDAHAKARIAEIIGILKAQMGVQADYDEQIDIADEAMATKDYTTAITHYQKAAQILPQEDYPKTQLKKAQTEQAAAKKKKADYEKAIQQGDDTFNTKDYQNALMFYKHAAKIDSEQKYPKEQINKINALLKQAANAAQNYETAIRQGDQQFNFMKYAEALASYEQALAAKPNDQYAQQQVNKTRALADKEQTYNNITAQGDELYMAKNYQAAKTKYEEAQQLLPKKQYATSMIAKVEAAIKKQQAAYAAQEEQYQAIIKAADKLLVEKKYEDAIAKYQEALKMRPNEAYPTTQIEKATALLDKHKQYLALIAAGDEKYNNKAYDDALYDYYAAKNLKPNEAYPQQKIDEIDGIINKQKALEAKYASNIQRADSLFRLDSLNMAQQSYQAALKLQPQESYPTQKLEEIANILKARAETQKAYEEAIKKADKLFNANKLNKARSAYEQALAIKPNEQYPKYKIEDINTIEEQGRQQQIDKDYLRLITKADAAFNKKAYTTALPIYQQAQQLKPKEEYPPAQINKINDILASKEQAEANYQKLIAQADAEFDQKAYTDALSHYKAALNIKPEESHPQKRIKEIENILADIAKKEAEYNALISKADAAFQAKEYADALKAYGSALDIKPNESYPKTQIEKINTLLAQADKDKAYQALIEKADKAFNQKSYVKALPVYQQAQQLKPKEAYPPAQIQKINDILASKEQAEANYQKLIAQADAEFDQKAYTEALSHYKAALNIKPEESHPQKRIKEIESILADIAKKEAEYNALISKADAAFQAKEYTDALKAYGSALDIKPNETYPKTQIEKINTLLAQADKDKAYQALIEKADKAFNQKSYVKALPVYQQAQQLKPKEAYPPAQIQKINDILASKEQAEANYQKLIAQADAEFNQKAYTEALSHYKAALNIKPEESHPQKRIKEIESILADIAKKEAEYNALISKADAAFQAKEYTDALKAYGSALDIKPNETYPKTQIEKINTILGNEQAYQKLIKEGDKAFAKKSYSPALQAYKQALTIKPTAQYPQDKIKEIENILQSAEALEQAYQQAIAQGDAAFDKAEYTTAKTAYTTALDLKPKEAYPKERLQAIEERLQALAALEAKYKALIGKADAFFNKQDWLPAQENYQAALQLKPKEAYPQQQLDVIAQKLQSQADKEAAYAQWINKGDEAMTQQSYQAAIDAYTAALKIFDKAYPKRKIAEAQAALDKQQQEIDARYKAAIAEGDRHFKRKAWQDAINAYQKALTIKPNENYPKDKIQEIEQLLAAAKAALQKRYDKWVAKGDKAFQSKNYQNAIRCYREALKILPDEVYPQQQIEAIMALLDKASNVTLLDSEITLQAGQVKRFTFTPVAFKDREHSYVLIEAQNIEGKGKIKLDFGVDNNSLGGFSFKLYDSEDYHLYFINLNQQVQWQNNANDFIKVLSEKHAIKIKTVKIGKFKE